MITTMTLNAAIDKTYYLSGFNNQGTNRIAAMHSVPGGKGINVARVIHSLGYPVIASGFIGGMNGTFIEREISNLGLPHEFIHLSEESRLCLNIIDEQRRSFEILEPGPTVAEVDYVQLEQKMVNLARQSKLVVFSGSLPRGMAETAYRELINQAKACGATVFLDTSGAPLRRGLEAVPFLIKPNQEELATLFGRTITAEQDLVSAIFDLMNRGISCVVVTLGAKGALAGYMGRCFRVTIPQIPVVNTVGCGDSFLAGMAIAVMQKQAIRQCFQYAAAVGTATALANTAGQVNKQDIDALLPNITVEAI